MKEKKVVLSIDSLYDEKAEALVMNLNARRFSPNCLIGRHDWVNASLSWVKGDRWVCLESPGIKYTPDGEKMGAFGQGYGGIRYCRRCKKIDCIHYWDSEVEYRVEHGKYHSTVHEVGTCRFCKLRILRNSYGEMCSSKKALDLIAEIAVGLGKAVPTSPPWGSGWVLEFPVKVSALLDSPSGEAAARDYVEQCFRSGDCSTAFTFIEDMRKTP